MDRQDPAQGESPGETAEAWADSGSGPGRAADATWLRPSGDTQVLAVGALDRAVILRFGRGPDLIVAPQAWERFLAEVRQGLYDNLLDR